MVFSLIERAARRALEPGEKVPNLLAGHVVTFQIDGSVSAWWRT